MLFPFGVLLFAVGWRFAGRQPYALRVRSDGSIQMDRVLDRTTILAQEILGIDKVLGKLGVKGEDARQFKIRCSGGSMRVSYLADVECFIAEVQALTPTVEVRGTW